MGHIECENATKRLVNLANEVRSSLVDLGTLGKLSEDSEAMKVICLRCGKLSEDLRVDGNYRKWKSFRQALKSVCTKD